jgi:hypothetical protein
MQLILKVVGSLTIIAGILVAIIGVATGGANGGFWLALTFGLPLLVTGALFHCFGAIVDHLAAIRDYQRRQTELLEAQK